MAEKKPNNEAKIDKARLNAVNKALDSIHKKYGDDSISIYADMNNIDVVHESTGSIAFDYITGGGLARGRIHEFFGPEGSGKTSVALQAVAEIQKKGGVAAFIDVEHALDPLQAKRMGVDMPSLILAQPSYGEQALEIMNMLIESGVVDIVILDSVAALLPKAELEGGMEDNQVGVAARMMGKALRKMTASANKTGTIVVFINQVRDAVGVMYGNPEVTPGGKALKFYSSIRVRVSKGKQIVKGGTAIGQHVFLKCRKNKVGMPFLDSETDFYWTSGMDAGYDIAEYGSKLGVIQKKGRNYLGLDGEPLTWNGEPITKKEDLAAALHDRKSGLIDMFYQPVLDAMDKHLKHQMDEDDEDEDVEDYDEIMEALDGDGKAEEEKPDDSVEDFD